MKRIHPLLLANLAFGLLLFILFNSFIVDESKLLLSSDQLNGLGSRYLRSEALALPQWDDSRLGGVPTIDAFFADAYHPLVFIQHIMDPARAVGIKFILTIMIAFSSGSLLFSYLTKKWTSGVLLATLFALNPQFFSHVYGGHDGKMMVVSIVPLALWSLFQINREKNPFAFLSLAFSIVWMLLSGHLQLAYLFLWGLLFISLFEIFLYRPQSSVSTRVWNQAQIGIALVIALLVSAPQVFPPYAYTTEHSVRGTDEKTTIEHASSWGLHQEEILSIILPGFIDTDVQNERKYWGHNPFKLNHDAAGMLLIILAIFAIFSSSNTRLAAFWCGAFSLIVLYSLGSNTPVFTFFYNLVPGVKNFRAPAMVIFWIPVGLALIASTLFTNHHKANYKNGLVFSLILGIGITTARLFWAPDMMFLKLFVWAIVVASFNFLLILTISNYSISLNLLKNIPSFSLNRSNKIWLAFMNLPSIAMLFLFIFGGNMHNTAEGSKYFSAINTTLMQQTTSDILPYFFLFSIIAVIVYFLLFKHSHEDHLSSNKASIKAFLILLAIGIFETSLVNSAFIQTVPRQQYIQESPPIIAAIKKASPDSLNDFRVLSLSRNPVISGNIFPYYHMRNALGFHDNEMANYREFRGGSNNTNFLTETTNNPFLDIMNIGFIIFDTQEGTRVATNNTAFQRTKVFTNCLSVPRDSILPYLKQKKIDHHNTLLLEKESQILNCNNTPSSQTDSSFSRIIENSTPDKLTIQTFSSQNAFLLISNNWHPFWKAKVNNQDTPVYKAFYTAQAIAIPKGSSVVEIEYDSTNIARSKILVYFGIFLATVLAFFAFRRSKNGKV